MSVSEIVIEKIIKISDKLGYVSENQIFELVYDYKLPLTQVDAVCGIILSKGIIILDEEEEEEEGTEDDEDFTYDRSRTDYDKLYEEVLSIQPVLSYLIADIKKIKPPQHREFDNLIIQAQAGNEFARTRIIHMYLRTAVKHALVFSKRYQTNLEETIQEAFVGLILALNQYEIGKNGKFMSYASLWMRQIMQRELPLHDSPIYCPMHIKENYFKLFSWLAQEGIQENHFEQLNSRKIELSKKFEIEEDKYDSVLLFIRPIEEYSSIHDEILSAQDCNNQNFMVEENIHNDELRSMLQKLSDNFPEREKDILALRYGFKNNKVYTLQEIADIYGITRERIRQIESKALRRFRLPARARILKHFF